MVAIFVALILGLAITYYVNDWYRSNFDVKKWQDSFYSQDFEPNKKKIYLIGSSQVHRLNASYIEKYISQTEEDYEIYNLGVPDDEIIKRIDTLQEIIDTKPVMVVYGITFRDLQSPLEKQISTTDVIAPGKPEDILPDPEKFFLNWIPPKNIIDFSNFNNPQITTLKLFKILTKPNSIKEIKPDSYHTPFHKYPPFADEILGEKMLKQGYQRKVLEGTMFTGYGIGGTELEVNTLKKIITMLKENNIEVVLFNIPYPKFYLDNVDNSDIEIFTSTLDEISNEFDVNVYHFYDKYADLKIWNNINHVSTSKKSIIFSQDLAEIILLEIKS